MGVRQMTTAGGIHNALLVTVLSAGIVSVGVLRADAGAFVQTDLVSDVPGLATVTDPQLVNAWGVSHSSTSPIWVSNQGQNTATLYTVTGSTNVSKVNINPPSGFVGIPTTATGPQGPTGQVANSNTASFPVGNGGDNAFAHFIFANLNGTISAWDTGSNAFIQATTPGAVYSGLAINQAQTRLFAANDAGAGSVDAFDSNFHSVNLGPNAFKDPAVGSLVPFGVQDINGNVYVAYAPSGLNNQRHASLGQGAIAVFDENGNLLQTLINGSQLAAPWGIARAPSGFGPFGGDLLVGNFSFDNSEINAFDASGNFVGSILINDGGNGPGGIWGLIFGNGGSGGDPNTLFVADGIAGETHGLLAAIAFVPEPSSLALLAAAVGLFGFRRAKRA